MNNNKNRTALSRRDFLKLSTAATITAVAGYTLYEYQPWLSYSEQTNLTWRPLAKETNALPQMHELVRYATLAANGHNTQPWKFAIKENAIEIHPDFSRQLPVVDPHNRELWISLGCALENLIVAARATGFTPEITYPDVADFIHVQLTADTPLENPLFHAIPLRQNTRSEFDGQPVMAADLTRSNPKRSSLA